MVKMIDKVEIMKIEKLIPYVNNPKEHPQEQIDKIASSIKNFGFTVPIIIDSENEIIAGHGRLAAAKKLDLKEVPVIKRDDLTDAQARALRLADNKVAESEWDDEILAVELEELKCDEFDLEGTGFGEEEISDLLSQQSDLEAEEDGFAIDEELNEEEDAIINSKDLIKLGRHRLLCGDSTDKENVKRLMNDNNADMVFTDPPYNVDYGKNKNHPSWKIRSIKGDKQTDDEWYQFNKTLAEIVIKYCDGDIYIWGASGPDGMLQRLILVEEGIHWSATIIWNKNHLVLSPAKYQRKYEPCFYGWVDKSSYIGGTKKTEVWDFDRPIKSDLHPTMKPIKVCAEGIENSSRLDDIVLDLFGGSGSTLIAAEQLDRVCYMMELDENYCDVIIRRYIKYKLDKNENVDIKINGESVDYNMFLE